MYRSVLNVHDDEGLRSVRTRILRGAGFAVTEAASGRDALRLAAENPPAAIVLDIPLPDLDGRAVCRELKGNAATATVPVLQVSAAAANSAGSIQGPEEADAYLVEPVDPEVLVATVRALVRTRHAQQQAQTAMRETERILSSITEGHFELDAEFRFRRVNRVAAKTFGRAESDLLGKRYQDELPRRNPVFEAHYRRALAEQTPVHFEEKSGFTDDWMEVHVFPSAKGLSIYFHNVTARRRHVEDLTRLHQLSERLALSTDLDEVLNETLRAAAELTGSRIAVVRLIDSAAGDSFIAASIGLSEEYRSRFGRAPATFCGGGVSPLGTTSLIVEDVASQTDNPALLEAARIGGFQAVFAVPLVSRRPEAVGSLGVMFEQPHRPSDREIKFVEVLVRTAAQAIENARLYREAQKEIARRADIEEALRRSNDDLRQFAYVASHDLKEPLRNIGGYSDLLQRRYQGRLDADANDFLRYIRDSVARMNALLHDLLAYAQVANHPEDATGTVPLEAVLSWALENLKGVIQETGARITRDPLPAVTGDFVRLSQILQNVIANSIKFHGEEPPAIHVSAARRGNEWIISVKDNGIGIEPRYHERIFGVFRRLHGSEYPGTGIGLSIAKKIIEYHGGRIWLESELGAGATFFFSLPADSAGA